MHSKNAEKEGQAVLTAETETNINRVVTPAVDSDLESDFNDAIDEHYGADDEENEFATPKEHLEGIKASVGGQVVIDTTPQEDLSAFDPSNFIATATAIVASLPPKKVDYISLRKPSPSEYVRVTAVKSYRMSPVYLLGVKKGMKTVQYLIMGKCVGEVLSLVGDKVVKSYSIVTAITNSGDAFLWYTREGADDDWSESAVNLQKRAINEWVRVEGAGTHYVGFAPKDKLNEPKWPTESFPQLLKLAFGSRIVDSVDHPAVKQILGINS